MLEFRHGDEVVTMDGKRCLVVAVEPFGAMQKMRVEPLEYPYYGKREFHTFEVKPAQMR